MRNASEFIQRQKFHFVGDDKFITELQKKFLEADPFQHIVIDDLFVPQFLDNLVDKFPNAQELKWWVYNNPLEKKLAFNDLNQLDPCFRKFFDFMNGNFMSFLTKLTGLNEIIPDPALNGGGLHQIMPGGKLDVHEDYNIHRSLKALRKLNVILYLNKDWKDEYEGHLQLWNKDMTKLTQVVAPTYNRLVIFRTDLSSNHGHPIPLACPENMSRKSLATYYYVNDPDIDSIPYRSTQFKKLPDTPNDPELDEFRKTRSQGRVENKTT